MKGRYGVLRKPIKITKEGRLKIFFFAGILLGTFFFNWWGKNYVEDMVIYKSAVKAQYLAVELNYINLCFYILKERGKQILLLLACCVTKWKALGVSLFHLYYGVCFGYLISAFVLQYHLMGLVVFLLWLMPHYLCYAFVWYVIFTDHVKWKKQYKIAVSVVCFLLGVLLESYVNTGLIQKMLQKF